MAEHMTVCGGHLTAGETASQIFSHAKVDKDKIFYSSNIQYSHMPRWIKIKYLTIRIFNSLALKMYLVFFKRCKRAHCISLHFVVILKKQR